MLTSDVCSRAVRDSDSYRSSRRASAASSLRQAIPCGLTKPHSEGACPSLSCGEGSGLSYQLSPAMTGLDVASWEKASRFRPARVRLCFGEVVGAALMCLAVLRRGSCRGAAWAFKYERLIIIRVGWTRTRPESPGIGRGREGLRRSFTPRSPVWTRRREPYAIKRGKSGHSKDSKR
jgi:hypothetical protein